MPCFERNFSVVSNALVEHLPLLVEWGQDCRGDNLFTGICVLMARFHRETWICVFLIAAERYKNVASLLTQLLDASPSLISIPVQAVTTH
jgi:hypothetical protein